MKDYKLQIPDSKSVGVLNCNVEFGMWNNVESGICNLEFGICNNL
jgi:hypothetical protein